MPESAAESQARRRPRIGITAWRRPLPTPLGEATDLYTLGVEYAVAVQAAGGLPLILPHGDDAEAMLDTLDGLVLSGGGDVDPRSYGTDHKDAKDTRLDADHWEIALVHAADARRLPVLGICRGMQVLAVAHGGRLVPEIAGREGHADMTALSAGQILAARHSVSIASESTLERVYGTGQRTVNTIHHQAVADPGDLLVSARAADGMIEAVEGRTGSCALGVQWHPEKLPGEEAADERRLFEHLIAEARAYAARRSD
jgi:putative glutamine amidotransferase